MKGNGSGRALQAFETVDTVLLPDLLRIFVRDRSKGTIPHAFLASSARVAHRAPKDPKSSCDREEGSKWAEITAPEPLS